MHTITSWDPGQQTLESVRKLISLAIVRPYCAKAQSSVAAKMLVDIRRDQVPFRRKTLERSGCTRQHELCSTVIFLGILPGKPRRILERVPWSWISGARVSWS